MGIYLSPDNMGFYEAVKGEIYVDKSELIAYTNKRMRTPQKYICVSRPRRFGKSMAADMLAAYYSNGCDSKELFYGLKITIHESYKEHLNQYNVIKVNMQEFLSSTKSIEEMIDLLQQRILWELTETYQDVKLFNASSLQMSLSDISAKKNVPFVFIIDEWDCIFRKCEEDKVSHEKYLDFIWISMPD